MSIRLRVVVLAAAFMVGFFGCAKKMLPPSPDRFAPHLVAVESRVRTQVELGFDEDIDASGLNSDSLVVLGPSGERVPVRGLAAGRTSSTIQVWAPFEARRQYSIRGSVPDRFGNVGRFLARFVTSDRADTISPRVLRVDPPEGATGRKRSVVLRAKFSEAVDTAAGAGALFVPARFDSMFVREWDSDWQGLRMLCSDSLSAGLIVYALFGVGAIDLEGNRLRAPAFTYFTPDSTLGALTIHGKVVGRPAGTGFGVVFFNGGTAPAMAVVAPSGDFVTKLRDGIYDVVAVSDTNGDWRADFVGRHPLFAAATESLTVDLMPELHPESIDSYRR